MANAVRVTLGPRGRHVLLEQPGQQPRFTKDGVTVALEIQVSDAFQNLGIELVRQVASKTAAAAGDGTTTAIVLAQAICHEGLRLVAAGHHGLQLKRGLEQALAVVSAELAKMRRSVRERDDVRRVATLSANGDAAIGDLVASALEQVGSEGVISVVEGRGVETSTEIVRGLQFDRGYLSPYFINDIERIECVFEDAWVLVCDHPIRDIAPLAPILEAVLASKKPLLLIADDFTEDVITALVINKLRANLQCCAVKAPSLDSNRLEHLRDVAAVTGAEIVGVESGLTLERLRLQQLGSCDRIVVQPELTTLIGGRGSQEAVHNRAAFLRAQLTKLKGNKRSPEGDVKQLETRVQRLSQGVAIVKVGGQSQSELRERKDRVEDAVCATQCALVQGVVPGGGVALLRCQAALDELYENGGDRNPGIKILRKALEAPLFRIAQNAGFDGRVVVQTVQSHGGWYGFDAARGEYVDLREVGVLDPTKVVLSALMCAVNITALMLTTRAMLADKYPRPQSFTPYRPDLFDDDDDDY